MTQEIEKIVRSDTWENWSEDQQTYVLAMQNAAVTRQFYRSKTWKLDKARPIYREICSNCLFDYCFYAEPRNYTIGDADVYNLMKCANVNCQREFESIL